MKCYLVASFDATATPPTLRGIAVYSESWSTLTVRHSRKQFYADLAVGEGDSFDESHANLMQFVDAYPGLHWVRARLKLEENKTTHEDETP
jgi:hypothetical protein